MKIQKIICSTICCCLVILLGAVAISNNPFSVHNTVNANNAEIQESFNGKKEMEQLVAKERNTNITKELDELILLSGNPLIQDKTEESGIIEPITADGNLAIYENHSFGISDETMEETTAMLAQNGWNEMGYSLLNEGKFILKGRNLLCTTLGLV